MSATVAFTREQLRAPFALSLLVAVPAVFVAVAARVLSDFATALGGSLTGDATATLSAGWAAAFIAGTLGFFTAASSRGADRRLALAGLGPGRVALARVAASLTLALLAATAAFLALVLTVGTAHAAHAAAGVLAFALLYLGIGVAIGSMVRAPLEGSLAVAFVFLLDVFSGPGMAAEVAPWSISRWAGDILINAGLGGSSSAADWLQALAAAVAALATAALAFAWMARRRA